MNTLRYYLLFNPDLKKLNMSELKESYSNSLIDNLRITSIDSFFKKYKDFDINLYKKLNKEIENKAMIDILIHKHLNNNLIYFNDEKEEKEEKNKQKKRLAHIFVHFFKIGGGESYISNFNKYNNYFEETLFINKNYPNNTLFNINCKIIYYNNYLELNNHLLNYDIILDHQLYWFEYKISNEAFLNISSNHIIRIIHGVPIHFTNITPFNFYYSIELYKEYKSDISWNNHIKIYNNIGIKNNNIIPKKFNMNNINIAIVGRINTEKISENFLKKLITFSNKNLKYMFNFYGIIDDSYSNIFLKIISKNRNLIYHGLIEPTNISSVYLNNDILLHPSKYEAGATAVLEAMSYGLPIICRNIAGLPNAVGEKYNFLCNSDNELLEKILCINDNNYEEISKNNILKIKNENNELLMENLISTIKIIHNYETQNDIPNIIHYVFGLEIQKEEFPFVFYLSIYSNYLINKPDIIYFHYQHLPYGYWWEKAKIYLSLNYINTSNLTWGKKKIKKFAHKADKIRLEMLLKYGGIYMDIDTITYKPYKNLLKYDFVIGIQEEKLYCNAILFSKKNNIFIKEWIKEYEKHFLPDGWCEASVHLPYKIYENIENKDNILILEKECFYIPGYEHTEDIFEKNLEIDKELYTLHFWNTYSKKYYINIQNFDWANTNNSLYSKLMKNVLRFKN